MALAEDQQRTYLDRRMALRNGLVDRHYLRIRTADALLEAWEAEAARRGLNPETEQFWTEGSAWLDERRRQPLTRPD